MTELRKRHRLPHHRRCSSGRVLAPCILHWNLVICVWCTQRTRPSTFVLSSFLSRLDITCLLLRGDVIVPSPSDEAAQSLKSNNCRLQHLLHQPLRWEIRARCACHNRDPNRQVSQGCPYLWQPRVHSSIAF